MSTATNPLRPQWLIHRKDLEKYQGQHQAVIHYEVIQRERRTYCGGQGAGSEKQGQVRHAKSVRLDRRWVLKPCRQWGWLVSPGILGIGIGGTAEKSHGLGKQSLMQSVDIRT